MNFSDILENGLAMTISIIAIATVVAAGRLVAKHIPVATKAATEFIKVWHEFTDAMRDNASAIEKNTQITDANHKHSEIVLRELEMVNHKFNAHDDNAILIKQKVDELLKILQRKDDSDEVLILLKQIIEKLEVADI